MYPSPISQYVRPETLRDALACAQSARGEFMFIAGGMSLMQAMKSRLVAPECVIDLNGIEELKGMVTRGDKILIGGMTRYRAVAENAERLVPFDAVTDAASRVGDRQVRNRGSVGGSIAWNHVNACMPVAALACAAQVHILRGTGSEEQMAIDDFQVGPLTTALDEGDLLTGIELEIPERAAGSAYRKWGIVQDALPVIGVAVYRELDRHGQCARARFAIGGLPSGPQRCGDVEARLVEGIDLEDPRARRGCARIAADVAEPDDDPWISSDYKRHLIERLGGEMLERAFHRARERMNG